MTRQQLETAALLLGLKVVDDRDAVVVGPVGPCGTCRESVANDSGAPNVWCCRHQMMRRPIDGCTDHHPRGGDKP
jgi:hypothetical protein